MPAPGQLALVFAPAAQVADACRWVLASQALLLLPELCWAAPATRLAAAARSQGEDGVDPAARQLQLSP